MSFPQQVPDDEASLEARLRGLILNNGSSVPLDVPQSRPILNPALPPHMLGASPTDQQAYFKRQVIDTSLSPPSALVQPAQGGRKRPNQAQRRQMNSQFLASNDTRPPNPSAQSGKGYASTDFSRSPHQNRPFMDGRSQSQNYPIQYRTPPQPYDAIHSQSHHLARPTFPPTQEQYAFAGKGLSSPAGRGYLDHQAAYQHRFSQQVEPYQRQQRTRNPQEHRQLYQPGSYGGTNRNAPFVRPEELSAQSHYLQNLADMTTALVGIDDTEAVEKERFRAAVEQACREAIFEHEQKGTPDFEAASVELKCFGSMASGFATKASDMDLALLTPYSKPSPDSSDSPIPRILERKLLDLGLGARLLTRTRVPIIKLCQKPTDKLMSDLLEERLKWENGFIVENVEDVEDVLDENVDHKDAALPDDCGPSTASELYSERLSSLRQRPNESLADYYGNAKRLLRQLGGRDISSAVGNITPDEVKILLDVSKAFVKGLFDEAIRKRLLSYQSLSFNTNIEQHTVRSLSSIYNQVEGERLATGWRARTLPEMSEKRDADCHRQVEEWQILCQKVDVETSLYSRQLFLAVDRLKHISSLQLHYLEQGQSEEPAVYYARAAKILSDLGGHDEPSLDNARLAVVITHYIGGLRNSTIQERLKELKEKKNLDTLRSVATHHQMLQLSSDYEKGIAANRYAEVERSSIEQYLNHIRRGTDVPSPLLSQLIALPDPTSPRRSDNTRDRYSDRLEFPKHDIGVQCDVNFSAQLALHNTQLLRCYSATDPRVRPMILFVKHWAKLRNINTPYRGTLSSYGYVLMVLHFLVNIASPFVCPNLQLLKREPPPYFPPNEVAAQTTCLGRDVRFWRNEREIRELSQREMLNHNQETLGSLLRSFFEYYAQNGPMSTGNGKGFDWGREVLSLRTAGGIVTKQAKGWVGARTVTETTMMAAPAARDAPIAASVTASMEALAGPAPSNQASTTTRETRQEGKKHVMMKEETKEIRHRYLFAIEDPFELDHNVARTVTHNGIVSIRDEFRRAWRIIREIGRPRRDGRELEGLLDEIATEDDASKSLKSVLEAIHGKF
ncbi:MAG: hypothetical protein M1818_001034 [Claussenomyces sp. TS43310]|nr:MAG: hypothetical protein M1818_001034 [Claussenomyces sp. TS43310]